MQIAKKELFDICVNVLCKHGVPADQAEIVADTIVFAHASGKATHGATRLGIYISKIGSGFLNPVTDLKVVSEKAVVGVYDAMNGFGQVAAYQAVEKAITKADTFGVGISAVRHSNNFGAAAYFANKITEQGKIGLIFTNSAPAIAPWGGNKPLFGTNPMAYGFPAPKKFAPIILDMAVSNAARGKIRLAAKNGEKIPFGWGLDTEGEPTDDPHKAIIGSMLPIGEHKGAGLAMVVDMLSGLLTGAGFAGSVKPLNTKDDYSDNGHLFVVLDPSFFLDMKSYYDRVEKMIEIIKNQEQGMNLFLPGEQSFNKLKSSTEYVEISEKVFEEIHSLYNQ